MPRRPEKEAAASYNWLDLCLATAVGLLSLALYWRTLAPGLLPSDSGEFQTLAYLLGNTHPTGYPVYLLLAKPFTWLPLGDVAYRVNLFSAVIASLAVAGVYLLGRRLTGYRWLAGAGALVLAVSPTFWSQALIAEVYTAGAAFLVAVLLGLVLWSDTGSRPALFLAGVMGGASLGVHMTVALLAPAVAVFLLVKAWNRKTDWTIALAGALAGLGLALAAFLWLDGRSPAANYFNAVVFPSHTAWDLAASDLDNPFERLAFGLSARQFRSLMFANPAELMDRQARLYWRNLPTELSWPTIILAAAGLLGLSIRRWALALLFFLALAAQWMYTFNYAIWDIYVFYIPGYVLLVLLAIAGMGWLVDGIARFGRHWAWPAGGELLMVLLIMAGGVRPLFAPQLEAVANGEVTFDFDGYPVNSYSRRALHPTVTALVQALDENAIVFTDWSMLYPLYYAAHVEQGRTDLIFIETFPHSEGDRLAASVLPYLQQHLAHRPIYFYDRIADLTTEGGYTFRPAQVGPLRLYRLRP